MKLKFLGLVLVGLIIATGTARAAVLELDLGIGSTNSILPNDFGPGGFPSGLATPGTTPITIYNSGDTGGLRLSGGDANIIVRYVGSEAGGIDSFTFDTASFLNTATAVGTTSMVSALEGILPFTFESNIGGGRSATNGGTIDAGVGIAFAAVGDGSFLALFNDDGIMGDYDDMAVQISVSQVPLPPAVWLLISAIAGLVSFSRFSKKGVQAA